MQVRLRTILCCSLISILQVFLLPFIEAREDTPNQISLYFEKTLFLDGLVNNNRLICVGEHGQIVLSDNLGKDWLLVESPVSVMLTSIDFTSDNVGWITGHDGIILKSENAGKNWTVVREKPEDDLPLFDVFFINDNVGLAVGAFSTILRTTDGGKNWQLIPPIDEQEPHLYDIAVSINEAGRERVYIAGEFGSLWVSSDLGETWDMLKTDYEGSFFGVLPAQSEKLFIYGLRGNIFQSDNLGQTWKKLKTDTRATVLSGIMFENSKQIMFSGLNGLLLKSTDYGNTFSQLEVSRRASFTKLVVIDEQNLLLLGEAGLQIIAIKKQ